MFPPDYPAARARFRELATQHGWAVESHPIAARGPGGEELTIDIAAHGPSMLLSHPPKDYAQERARQALQPAEGEKP